MHIYGCMAKYHRNMQFLVTCMGWYHAQAFTVVYALKGKLRKEPFFSLLEAAACSAFLSKAWTEKKGERIEIFRKTGGSAG